MARLRARDFERRMPVAPVSLEPGFVLGQAIDVDAVCQRYQGLDVERIRSSLLEEAEALLGGQLRFFSGEATDVGWPPRWLENPKTGATYDASTHWSRIPDLDPVLGDIKYVWEPSRFGFVYLLARAYALTGEDRYPEAFWRAVEDWAAANPVNGGPNWRCGQETSIRAMALVFGFLVFGEHRSSTERRLALAGGILRASGRRIAVTRSYALSQRNNHAVSESVGLWTLGALCPAWEESQRWVVAAERDLREVLRDQFYEDGGYAQYSPNYHRVALQNLAWLLVVARMTRRTLDLPVAPIVERSVRFLHALQDEQTGWLPNLGSNDGALLLPLSTCHFRDYRPALQVGSLLASGSRLYRQGPWDEEAIWLCPDGLPGDDATRADRPPTVSAPVAGCYVTRGEQSLALLRVIEGRRHRPKHADNLHLDVWINGTNVARDPGSYRYNAEAPWSGSPLASTLVHNTGCADGLDQMTRLGPFLWVEWTDARLLANASGPVGHVWVAEGALLPGSQGSALQRRVVVRLEDAYFVYDQLQADRDRSLSIHWNLPCDGSSEVIEEHWKYEGPACLVHVSAFQGVMFHETAGLEDDIPLGWSSPTYGVLEPVRSITARSRGTVARFRTCMTLPGGGWPAAPDSSALRLLAAPREQIEADAQRMVVNAPAATGNGTGVRRDGGDA